MNFIQETKRRRLFFILSSICVFGAAFLIKSGITQSYRSTAKFIVNEGDVIDLNIPAEFKVDDSQISAFGMSRMHIFLYSSECLDYLIRKFGLYDHYRIDRNRKFAYEKIVSRLTSRIRLTAMGWQNNLMQLTVDDQDPVMAADMANALVQKLDSMNSDFFRERLRRKIIIYNMLHLEVKDELSRQRESLSESVSEYRRLVEGLEQRRVDVQDMKMTLYEIMHGIRGKEQEILNIRQLHALMTQALETEKFHTILLVNKALADYRSPFWSNVLTAFAFAFFYLVAALFSLWIILENRESFRAYTGGAGGELQKRKTA